MSQFDFGTINPDTKDGTTLASDLGSWRDALHTNHRGASPPAYLQPGMLWVQEVSTTYWRVYIRANSGWTELLRFDPSGGAAEMAPLTVATTSLEDNAVQRDKILDGEVVTEKLANLAITAAKISDGTLTFGKLASAAVATVAQIRAGTAADKIITVAALSQALQRVSLTEAPTIGFDSATGINFTVNLSANRTMGTPSNRSAVNGRSGLIRVSQSGGPYTLSWATGWLFPNGEPPSLVAGQNLFAYWHTDSSQTHIVHAGGGFA